MSNNGTIIKVSSLLVVAKWLGGTSIYDMVRVGELHSKDVDALLIELSDKPIDYAEEEGQIIIHFSQDGEPVLIEILDAKEFVLNTLSSVIKEKEVTI